MNAGGGVTGRSVVVTGGSSGIGAAVVRALLDHGAHVTSLDLTLPDEIHPMLIAVVGDVTQPDAHAEAVDRALARFGRLDALVSNAGMHDGGVDVEDLSPPELVDVVRRVHDVNVLGLTLGVQAALPHLRKSRGSVVVTLSDASFEAGNVGAGPAYIASKTAALGLVRHFAHCYAPEVRVNAVAPGGVATGLQALHADGGSRPLVDDPDGFAERVRVMNPLGAVLTPAEIAEYYLFLLGDRAPGLTGQVLRPDGGLSVGLRRPRAGHGPDAPLDA